MERHRGRATGGRGRAWKEAATSQGTPGNPSGRGRKDPPPEPPEEILSPADTPALDPLAPGLREDGLLLFYPWFMVTCYGGTKTCLVELL